MAGAGNFNGGLGPAGFNPIGAPSSQQYGAPNDPKRQGVLLYDPSAQDFVLDGTGYYKAIHPVDQAVALALSVRRGSIASAPTVGHTLRSIIRAAGPGLVADVTDRVNVALKTLIDNGDIRVTAINVATPIPGRILVEVEYVNQRLQDSTKRVAKVVTLCPSTPCPEPSSSTSATR